jgi:hypothetical protein
MSFEPTPEQTTTARARVGAVWARLLAEQNPGRRYVVEWGERPERRDTPHTIGTSAPAPREIIRHVVDEERGHAAA